MDPAGEILMKNTGAVYSMRSHRRDSASRFTDQAPTGVAKRTARVHVRLHVNVQVQVVSNAVKRGLRGVARDSGIAGV